MERMTLAQAVGEAPIRDAGWSPDELDEWYGDDFESRDEMMWFERESALARENRQLKEILDANGIDY